MATKYWVGGNSGNENDYGTIANWRDDSTDAVPAAIPVADDIVLFDSRALFDATGSMAQGGVDLQGFRSTVGCRINIGASGAPLVVAVSNTTTSSDPTMTIANSEGTIYVSAGTNGIDKLVVEATSATGLFMTGGVYTRAFIMNGQVRQLGDCTITNGEEVGGNFVSDSVGAGSGFTTWRQQGGTSKINRAMTTADFDGGFTTLETNGTPTTLNMTNGSSVIYKGKNIATFNRYGGNLDLSQNPRNVTLGSSGGTMFDGGPGVFDENVAGIDITIGSGVTRIGKKKGG